MCEEENGIDNQVCPMSECTIFLQEKTEHHTGGDGELGCLCGKAGTSHLCDGSAHSSGCVVNGSNAMAAV